jgi:hypothetical protein
MTTWQTISYYFTFLVMGAVGVLLILLISYMIARVLGFA